MKLLAAFGDKRYAHMAAKARDEGLDAWTYALETAGVAGAPAIDSEELRYVDCVVMPNPFARGLPQPCAQPKRELDELLGALSPGTQLMLFSSELVPPEIVARFAVINLSADEGFTRENAELTAEGAISAAMLRAPFSIRRAECLIIGFGRIGYALNELLVGLGARTTVAARRDAVRRQAVQRGANAVDMDEMEQILPRQRIVFSTPPQTVLAEAQLKLLRPDALVIDLSSPPYGVELEAAQALGLEAWREPGLPGRYCPQSAGEALLRAVQTARKCGGV